MFLAWAGSFGWALTAGAQAPPTKPPAEQAPPAEEPDAPDGEQVPASEGEQAPATDQGDEGDANDPEAAETATDVAEQASDPETPEEVEDRVEREEGALGTLTEPGVVTLEQLEPPPEPVPDAAPAGADDPSVTSDGAQEEGGEVEEPARVAGGLEEPSTTKPVPAVSERGDRRRSRLGPADLRINDQGDRITIGFAAQLLLEGTHVVESAGQDGSDGRGVAFRRVRTVLSSSFLKGRVRSSFQLNIAPNAFELIDAWALYAPVRKLALRIGQFKVPFSRYRAQSFAALSRADWSPVTRMFGSERQVGLETLNPNPDSNALEYSFGIFTGANARASHAVGMTEVYGETPENPSDLRSGDASLTRFKPALVGRVARNFGAIDTGSNTDIVGGPLRHSLGLGAAGTFQPVEREDLTLRMVSEWLGKFHGAYVNAAVYVGWFPETSGGTAFGPWGLMLESGYRFDRTWELSASFSQTGASTRLRADARDYAEGQLQEPDLDDEQRADYAAAGRVRTQNELVLAANAYIVGPSLKVQLEGGWQGARGADGMRHEVLARLQCQLQF